MRTDAFEYDLPEERIAHQPAPERSNSRLMVVHRQTGALEITTFRRLGEYLRPGDLLVLNDSRVIPARLRGRKPEGGQIEILLLEKGGDGAWACLLRPGKRVRPGTRILCGPESDSVVAAVLSKDSEGICRIEFPASSDVLAFADRYGEVPLPPYIARESAQAIDRERYQTVYARDPGSVAAPTAGLHFSTELLSELANAGVQICRVTLHVGLGTFAPVKEERLEDHRMHSERYFLGSETVAAVETARREGRRVVAVGTTSLRVLESAARNAKESGKLQPGETSTRLFLYPPAEFHMVDALLTNFHLPRSTLLMLVSAFAKPGSVEGRDLILRAYHRAIEEGFRFFSYGDAMLLD